MYEELIKRLREKAGAMDYDGRPDIACDYEQAADAIEELGKYADTIKKLKCEGWYLQQTKYRDGYHAIATMPLPEPPELSKEE